MPNTPRFVTYKDKNDAFIIHMYHPRFVAKAVGQNLSIHDAWEEDNFEIKYAEVLAKMQKWWKFSNPLERNGTTKGS